MIDAAQRSPIWKMAMDWKIAFPMHPEFRTLPMVWYIPPLSPVQSKIDQGKLPTGPDGVLPEANSLRIPVEYLANLFTAGETSIISTALKKLLAMRSYMRSINVEKEANKKIIKSVGLSEEQVKEMYRYLAIANYEDRFVIPTGHEEEVLDDPYGNQGQDGFSFGNNSSEGISKITLFPRRRKETVEPKKTAPIARKR
jgi:nitrate reductase beta subunit